MNKNYNGLHRIQISSKLKKIQFNKLKLKKLQLLFQRPNVPKFNLNFNSLSYLFAIITFNKNYIKVIFYQSGST